MFGAMQAARLVSTQALAITDGPVGASDLHVTGRSMTVEELIEELQRMPNKRVPVTVRAGSVCCLGIGPECENDHVTAGEVRDVRFDGNRVRLEAE